LKAKKDEYDRDCGQVWKAYENCVKRAIKTKDLTALIETSRERDPLVDLHSLDFPEVQDWSKGSPKR